MSMNDVTVAEFLEWLKEEAPLEAVRIAEYWWHKYVVEVVFSEP